MKEMIVYQIDHGPEAKGYTYTSSVSVTKEGKLIFWYGVVQAKFRIKPKPGVALPRGILQYASKIKHQK